jgi:hypothetical protein
VAIFELFIGVSPFFHPLKLEVAYTILVFEKMANTWFFKEHNLEKKMKFQNINRLISKDGPSVKICA